MKNKIISSLFLFSIYSTAFANNLENNISKLPPETLENIFTYLNPDSLLNLKRSNKNLYIQVSNYINYMNNKENLSISGNIKDLNNWVNLLTNNKSNVNVKTKQLEISLNESLDFYFNHKQELKNILIKIAELFPNLIYLKLNEYQYDFYQLLDSTEMRKNENEITLKGTLSSIFSFMIHFTKYQNNKNISSVHFDLTKKNPCSTTTKSSYDLFLAINASFNHLKSVTINDLDNFYFEGEKNFSKEEFFAIVQRQNQMNFYFPLLEEITVIQNNIPEKFYLKLN